MTANTTSGGGIERAVTMVRSMLAALGTVTVLSVQATKPQANAVGLLSIAAAFIITALLLAWAGSRCDVEADRGSGRLLILQGLETAAFVGLAVILELNVASGAWAILIVPMVVASLRLNDMAVLGTWFVGSGGYALVSQLAPDLGGADPALLLERVGVLLAMAASVALLTRWLQEGWRAQRQLTTMAEERNVRLATIEHGARAMRVVRADEVLGVCIAHILQLGFEAAYATIDGEVVGVAGNGAVVPRGAVCETPSKGEVLTTRWTGADDEVVYSASVLEPVSGGVVSGWLGSEIDDALAQTLSDLVANAGSAIEAANHLSQARFEARHDPLTRLANRAELRRNLDPAASSQEPTALLFIDLDRFKAINDQYGHLVADRLLIALANRLTGTLNGNGLAVRFGGDEFVILLTGAAASAAVARGEEIRTALAEPFRIDQHLIRVTASIGVALTDGSLDPEYLLQQADSAAYAAKHAGRNNVQAAGQDNNREHAQLTGS